HGHFHLVALADADAAGGPEARDLLAPAAVHAGRGLARARVAAARACRLRGRHGGDGGSRGAGQGLRGAQRCHPPGAGHVRARPCRAGADRVHRPRRRPPHRGAGCARAGHVPRRAGGHPRRGGSRARRGAPQARGWCARGVLLVAASADAGAHRPHHGRTVLDAGRPVGAARGHPLLARRRGRTADPGPVEHAAGLLPARAAEGRRVAAPAALEAAVSRRHAAAAVMAAMAWLGAGAAQAATRVVVVAGMGGEPQYEERFGKWSEQVAQASATATGDPGQVQRLAGKNARREHIQAALKKAAEELKAGDQLVLVLIGHGSYDGSEYRFNIEGPDITGSELAAMLDRIPAQQLVVNATSSSGALAEKLANDRRVVITATRSGGERNATRFAGFWAEALTSEAADTDTDGNVTASEAFDYTVRRVADSFKADNAILTERARLEGREP